MVEQLTVNQLVVGSNPSLGDFKKEKKMNCVDILKISCCIVGMIIVPFSIIIFMNKDRIVDCVWREKIEQVELNNFSFEARRNAVYINKLIKVYGLCKELDIDKGFYLNLPKKLLDEINYIRGNLEKEIGKEVLGNMSSYKTLCIEKEVK